MFLPFITRSNPREHPRRHMERGVSLVPSMFTMGTLACGFYALLSTLRGAQLLTPGTVDGAAVAAFDNAAKAIGWAVVFDGLDGRIARLIRSTSSFGREFDSLADVIAFGLAPSVLAYAWGMRWLAMDYGHEWTRHLQPLSWIVCFAFVICGAGRLARFNLQSTRAGTDHRFFVGIPIPAAAGLVAAVVHWTKLPLDYWVSGIAWLAILSLLAFLMVSRIRYYSFKSLDLRRRRPYATFIFVGLIAWSIFLFSEQVLLLIASAYMLSGFIYRAAARSQPSESDSREVSAV